MIMYVLSNIVHPHGWWIVLDILLLGTTATVLVIGIDDDYSPPFGGFTGGW